MPFTVATYNVLATAYIKPQWYPHTPPEMLRPSYRVPAVVDHLTRLAADVFCLQEVEAPMFAAIDDELRPLGYRGEWIRKADGKPDGCAAFIQTRSVQLERVIRLAYRDGEPPSGHVAQVLVLTADGRPLGIANTHLKWGPAGSAADQRWGVRQVRELLAKRADLGPECEGWIVCGDLNVTETSTEVTLLRDAGFESSHVSCLGATCNPGGRAKMIDFLFHDAALRAVPLPLPPVADDTPLPGTDQPSDHVAVVARFEWSS